jgi:hypothetical protein
VRIKRVFPFDTGAFSSNLYDEFFDPRSKLEDFELNPAIETIQKFVGTFYVDNQEYFSGFSRKNVQIGNRQFEAQGVFELCRLPGVQKRASGGRTRDERSSAIEIQVSETVSLAGSLLAVILPEPYLDDPEIKEALARWEVRAIETYATLHNLSGEAWVGQIYEIARRLYERLGYIT